MLWAEDENSVATGTRFEEDLLLAFSVLIEPATQVGHTRYGVAPWQYEREHGGIVLHLSDRHRDEPQKECDAKEPGSSHGVGLNVP